MRIVILAFLLVIVLLLQSCQIVTKGDEAYNAIVRNAGRHIELPNETVVNLRGDSVSLTDDNLKILVYIDSTQCTACQMNVRRWNEFAAKLPSEFLSRLSMVFVANSKNEWLVRYETGKIGHLSAIIDTNSTLSAQVFCSLPASFRCFLLDEDNRVVLIGNPIASEKIEKLYLKTIMERLGAETE